MGVAFRCLIHLMWEALPADKSHLRPFVVGIALACGTPHPTAAPLSMHSTPSGRECHQAFAGGHRHGLGGALWDTNGTDEPL